MQRSGSMRSTKSAWHIILFMKRKKKNGQSISTSALIAAALESTGPFRLFYRPTVKFCGNILATENQLGQFCTPSRPCWSGRRCLRGQNHGKTTPGSVLGCLGSFFGANIEFTNEFPFIALRQPLTFSNGGSFLICSAPLRLLTFFILPQNVSDDNGTSIKTGPRQSD